MDILTKFKAIERWQKEPTLKKFKCKNKSHENLKPIIVKNYILLKCPICGSLFRPLNESVFEYGHMLLIQDKKKKRKKND